MSHARTDFHRDGTVRTPPMRGPGDVATPLRVLIVDDDAGSRASLEALLSAEGFAPSTAPDGHAALAEVERRLPDIVLTDLRMPGMDGDELCRRLHEIRDDLPVIIMTGHSDLQSVTKSLRAGAEDYLIKPLQFDAVLWCVERAITRRTERLEHEELYRALVERLVLSSVREQEHADSEAQRRAELNALLENLQEGVAIGDKSGRSLMLNAAARSILGLRDEDSSSIRKETLEVFDVEGRPIAREQRPLSRAARGEQFRDYELVYAKPSGERRRIAFTGTSMRSPDGDIALTILVFHDVTDTRRLERQREEYLALISHDLSSPLNSILLLVASLKQSLSKTALAEAMNRAERIERNVRRMTTMLGELTEATTLEARGVALRLVECDLGKLVVGVVAGMDEERTGRVTIDTEDNQPCVVLADASRLERVVANLLTNALKYSAVDAPVTVRLSRKGGDIELDVVDRGIGIAPDSLKMLFDRYHRTAAGKARAGGLGLGLYIARLIIDAHGGRIDVFSEVGKGSTFTVILPSHSVAA